MTGAFLCAFPLVYIDRLKGNRIENIEKAITHFKSSLIVRTYEQFPDAWALTQNNLAMAFRHRIQGDRAKNLERAIKCYQKALQVYSFEKFPEECKITPTSGSWPLLVIALP